MACKIPKPLRVEHEELHEQLAKISQRPGRIGAAAKTVAKILTPIL
jgi:hypothetical protein